MKNIALVVCVVGLFVISLALAARGYLSWEKHKTLEAVVGFEIPLWTELESEKYSATQLGADTMRIQQFKLNEDFARSVFTGCETYGYKRLRAGELHNISPAVASYFNNNEATCARVSTEGFYSISVLQRERLVVLMN